MTTMTTMTTETNTTGYCSCCGDDRPLSEMEWSDGTCYCPGCMRAFEVEDKKDDSE